jgi:hypothetical protein
MPEPAPLLVFADDWGRHPSSCQHLVSHVLPRRPVVWVNTIGTRPPRLDRATLRRGFEKVGQWVGLKASPGRQPGEDGIHPNLCVLNPKMWPSFRSRLARGLNRRLLTREVRPVAPAPVT